VTAVATSAAGLALLLLDDRADIGGGQFSGFIHSSADQPISGCR
jgi:hypothetical protein